jgi:2-iminobutanoate/2-iminopropanoate deaminase
VLRSRHSYSFIEVSMTEKLGVVHHPDRRKDVMMPYAPGIVVRRGSLVFLSGITAAAVYHSHPHRDEEFDLPHTMREQAALAMENLKKTLAAAGCRLTDVVSVTRYLTDMTEQDDLNDVWAAYLAGHVPATTTVEVVRIATHPNCKLEITAVAVADSNGHAAGRPPAPRARAKTAAKRRRR